MLREHLRKQSPELAAAADDLWRRSAQVHERQNRSGSLTENGPIHVKAVEDGIWLLLSSTPRIGSANNLDQFVNPLAYFILSAAACCHDFDKAVDVHGFKHGEGSADCIQKNNRLLGLTNVAHREAIQKAIRIHDLKGQTFVEALEKLETEEAAQGGAYNLQLISVLLKASDILHCDCTRIPDIEYADPKTTVGIERTKFLARNAVTGWKPNGNFIEIQIRENFTEGLDELKESYRYMLDNEWSTVEKVLQHTHFPYKLTMPGLPATAVGANIGGLPGDSRDEHSEIRNPEEDVGTDLFDTTFKTTIVLCDPIQSLLIPFHSDCLPKPLKDEFKFPEDIAFVNRIGPNCPYERFAERFSSTADILVLSGPQQIGKTWLARSIIDSIRRQSNQVTAFYVGISEEEIIAVISELASYAEKPEYLIYGLWCHKILRGIPGLPEEFRSGHKYAAYRFNGVQLVEDIAKEKGENPTTSVFQIITRIIEDALKDAKLQTQEIVVFFECDGMHKIEAAYPLVDQVKITKQVFQEELMLLCSKPQGHNPGMVKAIISTRPFDFKEIKRRRPAQVTDVYQPIGAFSKQECDTFLEFNAERIRDLVDEDTRFRDEDVIEKMKQRAYDETSGYAFFFSRWVRSFLFLAINSKKESCDKIADFIAGESVFWYYRDPLTADFQTHLGDSRMARFSHSSAPSECSPFLEEVLKHFVPLPQNVPMAESLFYTYCRRFRYVFDKERPSPIPIEAGQIDRVTQGIAEDEKDHYLALVRLGLVTFKDRSHDKLFLSATNRIIERFFDPYAVAEWMDIELKEEMMS